MNGMSINITWTRTIRVVSTGHRDQKRDASPHRHVDGRRLDDLRPDRPGAVRPAVRPARTAGYGLAPAGLGRPDPAGRGAPPAVAVPAADPARRDRPGRGDRRGDDAVHGGRGPEAARHRPRPRGPPAAPRGPPPPGPAAG